MEPINFLNGGNQSGAVLARTKCRFRLNRRYTTELAVMIHRQVWWNAYNITDVAGLLTLRLS